LSCFVCRWLTDSLLVVSSRKTKNKKNREEPVITAGQLPGNIGDKDVDYLTHYVIGQDARMTASVSRRDRKVADRSKDKKKAPERSNSQPESSSSCEEKVVDKMPKGRSTSPLDGMDMHRPSSPSQSDAPDEFIIRDEFSEDEKGYHTDQDSGFQLMIGKRRYNRHNRMSRLPVNRQQQVQSPAASTARPNNNVAAAATPSSPTASSSPSYSTAAFSVSGASASASGSVNLTSRGYESEKEFDNYSSSRQTTIRRRKTASSMPHSARNSPENSDVDSSLSLPIVHRLPPPAPPPVIEDDRSGRISYAQIARSASAAAAAAPAVAAASSRNSNNATTSSSNNNIVSKQRHASVGATAVCADAAVRVQVKSQVPLKSNVSAENSPLIIRDTPVNVGQELKTKATAMTAVSVATAASPISDSPSNVRKSESELSDTVIEVRPKNRLLPPSPATTTTSTPTTASASGTSDSRQQIRKHNSIPEASFKSMITTKTLNRSLDSARPPPEQPAVIMCDDSLTSGEQRISNDMSSTVVKFGFFDDLLPVTDNDDSVSQKSEPNQNRDQNQNESPPHDDKNPPVEPVTNNNAVVEEQKKMPQVIANKDHKLEQSNEKCSHKKKNDARASSISYPSVSDIDIETFNYNEILTYISKGLFVCSCCWR
jgi:hypothetical protein